MKSIHRLKLHIFLLSVCLLLCACGVKQTHTEESTGRSVSLWYPADSPLADAVCNGVAAYNENAKAKISLVEFRNEKTMANALENSRPSLILCSGSRAVAMSRLNRLRILPSGAVNADFIPAFSVISPDTGRSIFPLGAEYLAAVTTPGISGSACFSSLDSLVEEAGNYSSGNGIFFSAESFSELFSFEISSLGRIFNGGSRTDVASAEYETVYNLLAESAFDGHTAFISAEGKPLLDSGTVPCIITRSSKLNSYDPSDYIFHPVGGVYDSSPIPVNLICIAACSDGSASDEDISEFLSWFYTNGRDAVTVMEHNCLPCTGNGACRILGRDNVSFSFTDFTAEYFDNAEAFEKSMREAINNLR